MNDKQLRNSLSYYGVSPKTLVLWINRIASRCGFPEGIAFYLKLGFSTERFYSELTSRELTVRRFQDLVGKYCKSLVSN